VDYAAVSSARLTLEAAAAELSAPIEVKASDVYTSVEGEFDLILSNPPFHQGMENDETVPRRIIEGAPQLLKRGGSLLLVANSFLPYPNLLDRAFGSHRTLAKNSRFTVYQAVRA
jgi:16S rRNA (guanine1207-N2)-methyltransferase